MLNRHIFFKMFTLCYFLQSIITIYGKNKQIITIDNTCKKLIQYSFINNIQSCVDVCDNNFYQFQNSCFDVSCYTYTQKHCYNQHNAQQYCDLEYELLNTKKCISSLQFNQLKVEYIDETNSICYQNIDQITYLSNEQTAKLKQNHKKCNFQLLFYTSHQKLITKCYQSNVQHLQADLIEYYDPINSLSVTKCTIFLNYQYQTFKYICFDSAVYEQGQNMVLSNTEDSSLKINCQPQTCDNEYYKYQIIQQFYCIKQKCFDQTSLCQDQQKGNFCDYIYTFEGECLTSCATNQMIISDTTTLECAKQCLYNQFLQIEQNNEITCVDTCNNYVPSQFGSICIDKAYCDAGKIINIANNITIPKIQCVDTCEQNLYSLNDVQYCISQNCTEWDQLCLTEKEYIFCSYVFKKDNSCVDSCYQNKMVVNDDNLNCVQKCDDSKYLSISQQNGENYCVTNCQLHIFDSTGNMLCLDGISCTQNSNLIIINVSDDISTFECEEAQNCINIDNKLYQYQIQSQIYCIEQKCFNQTSLCKSLNGAFCLQKYTYQQKCYESCYSQNLYIINKTEFTCTEQCNNFYSISLSTQTKELECISECQKIIFNSKQQKLCIDGNICEEHLLLVEKDNQWNQLDCMNPKCDQATNILVNDVCISTTCYIYFQMYCNRNEQYCKLPIFDQQNSKCIDSCNLKQMQVQSINNNYICTNCASSQYLVWKNNFIQSEYECADNCVTYFYSTTKQKICTASQICENNVQFSERDEVFYSKCVESCSVDFWKINKICLEVGNCEEYKARCHVNDADACTFSYHVDGKKECVKSCSSDGYYVKSNGEHICITECSIKLIDVQLIAGEKVCVIQCSNDQRFMVQDGLYNICTTSCKPQYVESDTTNICVDFCPFDKFISLIVVFDEQTCVSKCSSFEKFIYNQLCVYSCKQLGLFVASSISLQCTTNCLLYIDSQIISNEDTCVLSCSKYILLQNCVDSCATHKMVVMNQLSQVCTSKCADGFKLQQGISQNETICVPLCDDWFAFNNECVQQCPESHKYYFEHVCLSSCTAFNHFTFNSESLQCIDSCPNTYILQTSNNVKTCIFDQSTLKQRNIIIAVSVIIPLVVIAIIIGITCKFLIKKKKKEKELQDFVQVYENKRKTFKERQKRFNPADYRFDEQLQNMDRGNLLKSRRQLYDGRRVIINNYQGSFRNTGQQYNRREEPDYNTSKKARQYYDLE